MLKAQGMGEEHKTIQSLLNPPEEGDTEVIGLGF